MNDMFINIFKRRKAIGVGVLVVLLSAGLNSQRFAKFCLDSSIKLFAKKAHIEYESCRGGLFRGFLVEGIEVSNVAAFNELISLKVQELKFKPRLLPFPSYKLTVSNSRLKTGDAELVMINLVFKPNYKQTDIFAQNANLGSLKRFIPDFPSKSTLDGRVKELDISIIKKSFRYSLQGDAEFSELKFKEFIATDLLLNADIGTKDFEDGLEGRIKIAKAFVQGKKTANISIKDSQLKFQGKYKAVDLNIKGQASVANVDINIRMTGNYKEPKLSLNSKPVLPRRALLAMIATNRRWHSLEETANGQDIKPDIAHGLINYFLFNNQSNFLSDKLAISDLRVSLEDNKQQIAISHDISEKIDLEYTVEKENDNPQAPINTSINLEFETRF